MNKRRWLLHIFERAHEPSHQAEERLQRTIRQQVPDGRASRALLTQLEAPTALQEQRLVARLADIPNAQPQRAPFAPVARPALVALAAVGLGFVVMHGLGQPDDSAPLATALEQQPEQADLAPFPGVHLAYRGGYGELGGTTRSPEIQWISGELEVEVEPDRGIQLAVRTEEATVRVIGTRFTVEREDAHTVVQVERGKVEVTCADGEQVYLTAGEHWACTSTSPSKLALRAVRMRERGADPDEVLAVVDRGLARAPEGEAAWSHLQVLRMQTMADLGQSDGALDAAQDYLDAGHARRRDEVLRLALGLSDEPCPLVRAHEDMLGSDQATPVDLVYLSDCLQADEPARARALLERALGAPGLPVQQRAEVQERLDGLR